MNAELRLLDLPSYRLAAAPDLVPFVKWPGGKTQELPAIASGAPALTGRYIDPFVGGGSVLLAVPEEVEAWVSDAAEDLIELYRSAADERRSFRDAVSGVAQAWNGFGALDDVYRTLAVEFLGGSSGLEAVSAAGARRTFKRAMHTAGAGLDDAFAARLSRDVPSKFERMRRIQTAVGQTLSDPDLLANVEGAIRAAFYMAIRARYNRARLLGTRNDMRLADFFFLREFAYAAMFRFNSLGEFNVPYGGITYNRKSFAEKVDILFSSDMLARLQHTTWRCTDFELFLREAAPVRSDFVFVDPPYDSDFSDYDNLPFGGSDQERLQRVLEGLSANVMIVIKDTPMIRRLYRSDRWRVAEADKTYMWTIKSRNDRETTHLTITNY
jgi:DNA adenine methylase